MSLNNDKHKEVFYVTDEFLPKDISSKIRKHTGWYTDVQKFIEKDLETWSLRMSSGDFLHFGGSRDGLEICKLETIENPYASAQDLGCMWNLGVELTVQSLGIISLEISNLINKYRFQKGNLDVQNEIERNHR